MLEDDVRIRAVFPEEAEVLSEIAWRSKEYLGYSLELTGELRDFLAPTQNFLENNPSYLIEEESTGEIIGFYSLEQKEGDEWRLRHHWVVPERIGTAVGQLLFLDACEVAETVGAKKLSILSDPCAESLFLNMGAERVGTERLPVGGLELDLSVLEIKLA